MVILRQYDSIPEYIAYLDTCDGREALTIKRSVERDSHSGGLTYEEAKVKAIQGDDTNVAQAQALIERIEHETPETPVSAWVPNVFGAFPCVPEYLAGNPFCMRSRVSVADESNPIALYVPISAMAVVSAETIVQRGLACLALTLRLQSYRPVELYLYHGWEDDILQVIKVETRPLALDTACFAMTSAAFLRKLCFVGAYQECPD